MESVGEDANGEQALAIGAYRETHEYLRNDNGGLTDRDGLAIHRVVNGKGVNTPVRRVDLPLEGDGHTQRLNKIDYENLQRRQGARGNPIATAINSGTSSLTFDKNTYTRKRRMF